ncbi:MAG: hypothetical protein WBC89_04485 [Dehalococcoidia bacterium]
MTLFTVWGSSPADVFAVGDNGTILHYDGGSWREMRGGTSEILMCVWGSSSSDVFAVGLPETIFHYDGHSWVEMTSSTPEPLWGIWGSSPSDILAVGGLFLGTVLRYSPGVEPG